MITKRIKSSRISKRVFAINMCIMFIAIAFVAIIATSTINTITASSYMSLLHYDSSEPVEAIINRIRDEYIISFVVSLISTLVVFMIVSTIVTRKYVVNPLTKLTESVSRVDRAETGFDLVYGFEREDEFGDLSKTISGMLSIIDTTQKKRLEDYDLNIALIESAPYVIALWKPGNVHPVYVSDQAKEFFGIDDCRQITDNLFSISPEFQPCGTPTSIKAVEVVSKTYEVGYHRFEWLHHKSDGTLIPSECVFKHFERNGEDMLVSYTRDLTEVKAAEALEREAREALENREKLLNTVNEAAVTLLAIEEDSELKPAIIRSMETIGECLNADRVHLMRCDYVESHVELVCIGQWLSVFGEKVPKIKYGSVLPNEFYKELEELYAHGLCYNGPVSNLPTESRSFFNPDDSLQSIVIIPLFMNGKLWGLFNIDFCAKAHILPEKGMAIIRSAGLMYVNVFGRFAQKNLAMTDSLTGVRNRRYFDDASIRELSDCIEKKRSFSLIMADIDNFKTTNDKYGHIVGDEVLKIFTARIRRVLKADTLLARYGGEEFVITLSGVEHEDVLKTAWRLNKVVGSTVFKVGDIEINITASFGVASIDKGSTNLTEIIECADKAMYQAKNSGRNRVVGKKVDGS